MRCRQCGHEVDEGEKFCGQCGCPIEEPQPDAQAQQTAQTQQAQQQTTQAQSNMNAQYANQANNTNPDDKKIVLQIFAGIFTAVFVCYFFYDFFGGIVAFFSSFARIGYGIFPAIYSMLMGVLRIAKGLLELILAATLLYTLLQWSWDKAQALFVTAAEVAVVEVALVFIRAIFTTLYNLIEGYSVLFIWRFFLKTLVICAVVVGIYFGILYLMSITLEKKLDKEMLLNSPKFTFDNASAYVKSLKKNQSGAANANAYYTAPNPNQAAGYTAPNPNQAAGYTAPNPNQAAAYAVPPVVNIFRPLKTDRSIAMFILLNIVTCGIYGWFFIHDLANDVNTACAGDNDSTPGLLKFILLSMITCGIYSWVWYYKLGNRLAANAPRYGLVFQENGTTVLLWMMFGILLCGIGQFFGINIVIKNTNAICMAYNNRMTGSMTGNMTGNM